LFEADYNGYSFHQRLRDFSAHRTDQEFAKEFPTGLQQLCHLLVKVRSCKIQDCSRCTARSTQFRLLRIAFRSRPIFIGQLFFARLRFIKTTKIAVLHGRLGRQHSRQSKSYGGEAQMSLLGYFRCFVHFASRTLKAKTVESLFSLRFWMPLFSI